MTGAWDGLKQLHSEVVIPCLSIRGPAAPTAPRSEESISTHSPFPN